MSRRSRGRMFRRLLAEIHSMNPSVQVLVAQGIPRHMAERIIPFAPASEGKRASDGEGGA